MALNYDYEHDYVEKNLIAYIGNKRRLLPLILRAIKEVETNGSVTLKRQGLFIDYFAGTGVVARLAKSLGYKVVANDWEEYACIINKAFIESSDRDLALFKDEGGICKILADLNRLGKFIPANAYISRYYCPENDLQADPHRERMFYTRQNGILIDNIRAEIDRRYAARNSADNMRKKDILLSLLLYEASRRSNTNGVFKAFHNGFGGRGRDALSRILTGIKLSRPALSRRRQKCLVYKEDALKLSRDLKKEKADIVYLDPPYNQHQYGSNYHLLNTISLNDKPRVQKEFMQGGRKIDKSAIRKDWIKTKSDFCYRDSARARFKQLLSHINARYILVSYSTEGIIDFDQMLAILSEKGRLGIVTAGYVRYRGGRQALTTRNKNVEFVLIVDTNLKNRIIDTDNVKGLVLNSYLTNIFEETFPLNNNYNYFSCRQNGGRLLIKLKGLPCSFYLDKRLHLEPDFYGKLISFAYPLKQKIYIIFKKIFAVRNDREIEMILEVLKWQNVKLDRRFLISRLITLYNKINPKKTPEVFSRITERIQEFNENYSLLLNNKKKYERFLDILSTKKEIMTRAAA